MGHFVLTGILLLVNWQCNLLTWAEVPDYCSFWSFWREGTKPFSGKCTGSTPVFVLAVSRCFISPAPCCLKHLSMLLQSLFAERGSVTVYYWLTGWKSHFGGPEGQGGVGKWRKKERIHWTQLSKRDWKAKRHYSLELTAFLGFFRSHPQAQEPQCQFGKASTLQARLRSRLLSPLPLLHQQTRTRSCPTVTAQVSRDGAPLVQVTTAPKQQLTSHGPPMAKISAGKDHGLRAAIGNGYLHERGLNQQPFLCYVWTILAKQSVSCWCLKPSQPYRCFG